MKLRFHSSCDCQPWCQKVLTAHGPDSRSSHLFVDLFDRIGPSDRANLEELQMKHHGSLNVDLHASGLSRKRGSSRTTPTGQSASQRQRHRELLERHSEAFLEEAARLMDKARFPSTAHCLHHGAAALSGQLLTTYSDDGNGDASKARLFFLFKFRYWTRFADKSLFAERAVL